jgi:hypothetical protein
MDESENFPAKSTGIFGYGKKFALVRFATTFVEYFIFQA